MYVCIHVCIYIYMYIDIYTYICIYIYTCLSLCSSIFLMIRNFKIHKNFITCHNIQERGSFKDGLWKIIFALDMARCLWLPLFRCGNSRNSWWILSFFQHPRLSWSHVSPTTSPGWFPSSNHFSSAFPSHFPRCTDGLMDLSNPKILRQKAVGSTIFHLSNPKHRNNMVGSTSFHLLNPKNSSSKNGWIYIFPSFKSKTT